MSRSVSVPSGAVAVAYKDATELEDEFDWEYYVDSIKYQLQSAFPSLEECDKWLGREDHAILENGHCHITVSEYCGLVAVSLVPKEHDIWYPEDIALQNLSGSWCAQIESRFLSMLREYRKVATASNGEAFFERCQ